MGIDGLDARSSNLFILIATLKARRRFRLISSLALPSTFLDSHQHGAVTLRMKRDAPKPLIAKSLDRRWVAAGTMYVAMLNSGFSGLLAAHWR